MLWGCGIERHDKTVCPSFTYLSISHNTRHNLPDPRREVLGEFPAERLTVDTRGLGGFMEEVG